MRAAHAGDRRRGRRRLGDDHVVAPRRAGGRFRHRADPRGRHRDRRERTADHLRPGTQSASSSPSPGALAYRRGTRHLVAGMCETDYSGYPDCRDDTIKAMQVALDLGMDRRFVIHTPLMWIDKAATFALGAGARRRPLRRPAGRGHPHLLSRRPLAPPRLGLRLRAVPGLPFAGRWFCQMEIAR